MAISNAQTAIMAAVTADLDAGDLPQAFSPNGREITVITRLRPFHSPLSMICRRTPALLRREGAVTFRSALGDAEMFAILARVPGKFAADLMAAARRPSGMSESQESWAHKLANDWLAKMQNSGDSAPADDDKAATFAAIVAQLQAVKGRSKSVQLSPECALYLSRCKTKVSVKNPANCVNGRYGYGPEWLGYLTAAGFTRGVSEELQAKILEFANI